MTRGQGDARFETCALREWLDARGGAEGSGRVSGESCGWFHCDRVHGIQGREGDKERRSMAEVIDILSLVPSALNLRSRHLWLDYDEEADVLYMSLRKPQ
jgi:hypothetical protein